MHYCMTFCCLSLQGASAPGQCCWGHWELFRFLAAAFVSVSDEPNMRTFQQEPLLKSCFARLHLLIVCAPSQVYFPGFGHISVAGPTGLPLFLGNRQPLAGPQAVKRNPHCASALPGSKGVILSYSCRGWPHISYLSLSAGHSPGDSVLSCVPQLAVAVPAWAELSCCLGKLFTWETAGCFSANQFSIQYHRLIAIYVTRG